jgi:hypothetical protein
MPRAVAAVVVAIVVLVLVGTLAVLGRGSSAGGGKTPAGEDPVALEAFLHAGATPAPAHAALTHLVLVASHAVFLGGGDPADEQRWVLEPYQVGHASTFVEHVRAGLRIAAADRSALVVFSGGQTRPRAGPRSEAQSYWALAEVLGWPADGAGATVSLRATTEEHARDSYENLLFSLCRFREVTGHYPARVTVVSLPPKRARFEDVHRAAVRYPAAQFEFVGVGPEGSDDNHAYERALVRDGFARDPAGCRGAIQQKRAARNPQRRVPPYLLSCPELRGLLLHCDADMYAGPVPW